MISEEIFIELTDSWLIQKTIVVVILINYLIEYRTGIN